MSKKIQLSIAEPCHENWDNMSPVTKVNSVAPARSK